MSSLTHATAATPPAPTLDSQAKAWLRIEGLAALIAGSALYGWLGGNWLAFAPLLLMPDLSAIGYLAGNRIGALTYNAIHNWAIGLAVLGAAVALQAPELAFAGAILVAHVGMDRASGYGLKLLSGFGDTHLGHKGRARAARATAANARPMTSEPAA